MVDASVGPLPGDAVHSMTYNMSEEEDEEESAAPAPAPAPPADAQSGGGGDADPAFNSAAAADA